VVSQREPAGARQDDYRMKGKTQDEEVAAS
jgi:hypothetical protein